MMQRPKKTPAQKRNASYHEKRKVESRLRGLLRLVREELAESAR